MKNEVVLRFCIWGFDDISLQEITDSLNIQPSRVYIKGQKKNANFSALAKENGWIMGSGLDKYSSFEDQMNSILDIIESKLDLFKSFCSKYYCEFSCAIVICCNTDESTPWVHLDSRYNRLIKDLNIEFDIDLYCLPGESD